MSSFTFFLFCVQACLVQHVYSQLCAGPAALAEPFGLGYGMGLGGFGAYGPGAYGFGAFGPGAYDFAAPGLLASGLAPYSIPAAAEAYGGEGIGDMTIFGEIPVGGTTVLGAQVPILGAVEFGGPVAAAGSVTIGGRCGCGANRAYLY